MVGTARCAVRGMPPERDNYARTPQRDVPPRPVRKRLPHEVPLWVDPSREDYFITVCCEKRGRNLLANPQLGHPLLETIKHRHARGIWYAHLALVMPDHVHLILSFPEIGKRMKTVVSKWKEWSCEVTEHRLAPRFFRASLAAGRELSRESRLYPRESSQSWLGRAPRGLAIRIYSQSMVGTARCAVPMLPKRYVYARTPQRGVPTNYLPSSSASAPAS
jgi:REP element-mobilizing transposase RayT